MTNLLIFQCQFRQLTLEERVLVLNSIALLRYLVVAFTKDGCSINTRNFSSSIISGNSGKYWQAFSYRTTRSEEYRQQYRNKWVSSSMEFKSHISHSLNCTGILLNLPISICSGSISSNDNGDNDNNDNYNNDNNTYFYCTSLKRNRSCWNYFVGKCLRFRSILRGMQ